MRNRDLIVIMLGAICMFVFVGYMFDYYIKSEQIQIIKKNMQLDSLILKEQQRLHRKDSVIDKSAKKEDTRLNSKINQHDKEIKKIIEQLENLK